MAEQAFIVTDLGYGDTGKGTTVDYLVRQAKSALVIRHTSGPQAAHNVVLPDGTHHTFSQFGSGSFVPGVRTHLSGYMLVNPTGMFYEADHLIASGVDDIWQRVSVDPEALVITPWHRSANRLREIARGDALHGSCGHGVGETMADSIGHPEYTLRVQDLMQPQTLRATLRGIRAFKHEQLRSEISVPISPDAEVAWSAFDQDDLIDGMLADYAEWLKRVKVCDTEDLGQLVDNHELLIFESAQGVLLDEWHGFHPYTTWSTTTHHNALQILDTLQFPGDVTRLGLIRAYMTRHGAGPFVTEDPEMTKNVPDIHNGVGRWQGKFRVGHLDLVAHRYAVDACRGVDKLVVTGLDRIEQNPEWHYCTGYQFDGPARDYRDVFRFDDRGHINRIIPGPIDCLDRQERITRALASCHPEYQGMSASFGAGSSQERVNAYLAVIEERLGAPVALASFGPTWSDKRALVAC